MMNKFITIADKLDWPVAVQIDRFITILPMDLHQFVIVRPNPDFEAVRESIRVHQDMIEVNSITHSFKNISFSDDTCNLCCKDHQSLCCPSLKSIIEMEMSSNEILDLEIGVIAKIVGAMTGKAITGHGLSTEGVTVAIGIDDLVVLSIETTVIGKTGMVGPTIDAISNMGTGVAAYPLGSIVIGIITMVLQITSEVEATH